MAISYKKQQSSRLPGPSYVLAQLDLSFVILGKTAAQSIVQLGTNLVDPTITTPKSTAKLQATQLRRSHISVEVVGGGSVYGSFSCALVIG